MVRIYNIPCYIKRHDFHPIIESTLDRIRKKAPKDFADLQRLVRKILPYRVGKGDRTLGEWKADHPRDDEQSTWDYGWDRTPGVLMLSEKIPIDRLISTFAHELGHAATCQEDRNRRKAPFDEWDSELAADWYAYKWGFGREIARHRKIRDWGHHLTAPGSTFEVGHDGKIYHYRITRNFCVRLVKVSSGSLTQTIVGGGSGSRP